MKKLLLILSLSSVVAYSFGQNETKQILGTSPASPAGQLIQKKYPTGTPMTAGTLVNIKSKPGDSISLPLSKNGKLISVDGYEVDFKIPSNPSINTVCSTPRPVVNSSVKNASCPFTVPCDNPSNRDGSSYTTTKYIQLVWHVMWDGGAASNINQARIDDLMAELNSDFAAYNVIFCTSPASFYEDAANYDHDSNTEEWQLKDTYNVTPEDVINIYVVGDMSAGGYARFPYDPNGGTDPHGGIVLNRGNCSVGTHTLAHEMGHTFGLEHTFAGVDERSECSSCYERVRNANGSPNTSGAATPLGGPYLDEGDREGDWCSDTNPHDTYSYNCSTSSNTNGVCDAGPWANAPVNNHMSYSFCSSQFTAQQSRRMHCMLDSYLGSWTAFGGGLCGSQPPVADFVGTPTTWQAPSTVNFTDLSAPQSIITGWTWTFDVGASGTVTCAGCAGANATFVGQVPPVVTYPNPGLYTVSLTITSANGNDTETKVDYIEVLAPAGDCDTLDTQWETPAPTPSIYTFGGGYLTGVQDPANSLAPTDLKGVYERYFTPNPGVTQVGAARVGLGFLEDADDDMVIQVVVFDDDGFGAPGAVLGGVGGISPTQLGVPGAGFFNEFWIQFDAVTPTTGTFHIGVEMIPGDANDSILVVSSAAGQGEGDFSNHIWTTGFGYENFETDYGINFDLDIVPMLGEWAPLPLITGFTENVVCDTTYVTLFDTALYSSVASWSFTFSDGTVINSTTDPMTIDRVYTTPGPETVTVATVNDCGRSDTTVWVIPYGFLETPDAEFSATPNNPVCMGAPGVDFTADVPGYVDYTWDFGDGTAVTSSGNVETVNHVYTTPGTYYVELTTTQAGYNAADTFYLEDFEGGWPAGYARFNMDAFTPDPGVNPPFTGTDATAWLPLDIDGDGDGEAVSTSWNGGPGQLADDWMLTSALGVLPANQRLFWDAEALDPAFPDGYEVRISTTAQLPATVGNYNTILYSTPGENAFNTTHSVDLSTYAGQTVYIAFRNNSDWMFLLSIDNIRIGTATPGCDASVLKADYIEVIDCSIVPPTTVLNSDVTGGCGPLTVTFTDGTTVGDPADEWLWNFGDGTFSTVQNPPPHVYATAGSYFVVFESCNSGGCTQDTVTIFVGDPAVISNVVEVDPTCAGNDGSITITATGGTGALQYSIDNGVTFQASNVFNGLGAGTFDIVVEDAIGCQATTTATLVASAGPSITLITPVDPLCNGGADGSITITASGGAAPIQYSIDNGVTFQAGNSFTGLTAGTYDVVIEDASGCQATQVVTLVDPIAVSITSVTGNDPSCSGALDGDITITASGGTGALQYSIDNGVTFQAGTVFTGLGAGTYDVVVEDADGCQMTSSFTLTDPPAVVITFVSLVDPTCNGASDGSITITASGGIGALQYSIDNGVTFQAGTSFTGLAAGTYNLVVEDANGCQATQVETLVDPAAVIITAVTPVDPTCGGNDGSITIAASGGTGALLYSIDNGVTFQASTIFNGLGGGTYDIVVEDANGCQATSSVVLTPSAGPTITMVVGNDPACAGSMDGDITITVTGGAAPIQYSIDNGVTFQAGGVFTGLGAGVYNIVVEDAGGCQATQVETLVDPPAVSYSAVIIDETCGLSDGEIELTGLSGAGAPYSYSIDNGVTFQGSGIFPGLVVGNYNIVVEDANGCQVTGTETVNGTGGPSITGIVEDISLICNGDCNGQLTATVTGGTLPYQYSWVGATSGAVGGNNATVNGLCADTYTLTVIDNAGAGCSAVMNYSIVEPTAVTYSTSLTDETCGNANGQIDIVGAAGGSGAGYQYSIDNGVTFQGGTNFSGLTAGSYNVVVTDGSGCPATSIETLSNSAGATITGISAIDPSCGAANGQITITATGGTGALQYSIDNGVTFQASNVFTGLTAGVYDIVVEDAIGCQTASIITLVDVGAPTITGVVPTDPTCGLSNGMIDITATGGTGAIQYSIDNGVTFQGGTNFSGLAAGSYDVVIEDANGCQAFQTVTLTNAASPTITTITANDPTCGATNGDITITASGGTGPLEYSIDNGATFQASSVFTGLGAGTYNIVVEDANGCQTTAVEILVNTAGPSIVSIIGADPTCGNTNGSITITASGGTGPLEYSIDNGVTFQASGTFSGLSAGVYDVVIQDANGCQTASILTLTDPGAPVISGTTPTNPSCGAINGSIVIGSTGGSGAIQYSIDNGVTFQGSGTFNGLAAGTYNVVIQDANGCTDNTTVVLVDAGMPTLNVLSSSDASCDNTNGTISLGATGGGGGYQYSIDGGTTWTSSANFTGLGPGTYTILVQDANGCQDNASVTLTQTGSPVITIDQVIDLVCFGDADGQVLITVTGGTAPYQYDWSTDGSGDFDDPEDLTTGVPGMVSVTVVDANGCAELITATISGPADLWAVGISTDATLGNDGSIDLSVGGGTPPYSYSWSNGSTDQDLTGLAGNATYTVTVTDANGCTFTTDVFVGSQVSINELENPMGVIVAPNPNNGEFSISLASYSGSIQVNIIDVTGRLVYREHRSLLNGGSFDIDLSREGAGVYFVNVSSETDIYSTKVIRR